MIVAAFTLFAHSFAKINYGDDLYYTERFREQRNLSEFLISQYRYWTSRLIVEALNVVLTQVNPWVWRILDTIVVVCFLYHFAHVFGIPSKQSKDDLQACVLTVILVFLIPPFSLYSAGWLTTGLNYLWPLTFGIIALRPIWHFLRQ